jgi:hypothetical protein
VAVSESNEHLWRETGHEPPLVPHVRAHDERAHAGRVRLPAVVAVLVAIALYTSLPSSLIVGPRAVLPVFAVALLVPLALASVRREAKRVLLLRRLSILLILLIAIVNSVALVLLVSKIVNGEAVDAAALLLGALQVWLTNVITFALIFWELDRGGPVVRARASREDLPAADFRFPQDEDHDAIREVAAGSSGSSDWRAGFVDYLYVSTTNSSAFSPTDTMPLTSRVKILMAIQSTEALVLSLLVVAQAVSLIES